MNRTSRMAVALVTVLSCAVSHGSAQDQSFTSDGVRLRYVERGQGEVVVLLHGDGASIEANWADPGVIDALATDYRVVALDFRGYGRSDKPHDPAAYGSHMGEDVVRLLDHLNAKRAHVVGYSLGARVTSWLVVNQPERLISATLAASTYYVDTPAQRQSFEAGAGAFESGAMAELIARAYRADNPTASDAEIDAFVAKAVEMNDPQAIAANSRGMTGLFIEESALSKTVVPVLHVVGSLDTPRLPASHRLKDEVLPAAQLEIVEGATHMGPQGLVERPEFVEALTAFLGQHH